VIYGGRGDYSRVGEAGKPGASGKGCGAAADVASQSLSQHHSHSGDDTSAEEKARQLRGAPSLLLVLVRATAPEDISWVTLMAAHSIWRTPQLFKVLGLVLFQWVGDTA
jgi:hypothetical protein